MDPESRQTEELLSRLTGGEPQVLAELFGRHRPSLKRMVHWRLDRRLRGRIDPSDVLQDVYMDVAQRLDGYLAQRTLPFGLWLRLLTGRRLLELHRYHLGAQLRDAGLEISLEQGHWPPSNPEYVAAHLTSDLTSPSQAALRAEREAHLLAALRALDPLDREVLVLRHFEELTNNEVATLFGIGKSGASLRYLRALGRLREALAGMTDFFLNPT
jgi:RNA polymerase sigma-70 factor (ECF subfamily)